MGVSPITINYWVNMLRDGLDTPFSSRQAYEHICTYKVKTNGGARLSAGRVPTNVSALAQVLKSRGSEYGLKRVEKMTQARYVAMWDFVDNK